MLEAHRDLVEALSTAFRRRHGLAISDFDVLINIGPHESVRHRDLAQRVVLSRSALSRLIDRLIARGLLTRSPDAEDSRGVLIGLTPAGRALREESERTNEAIVTEAFAVLDAEEADTLHRIAAKLAHTISARTTSPAANEEHQEMT